MIEYIPQLPETRLAGFARIRRERRLPIPGEVTGAVGIRIGAQDVVARAYPPKMRRALSLTRVIGVREADVPKRLMKQVGDPVEAREIIIAKPINLGVQRLVYRAPEAGQIAAIQGSWMVLDLYGQPYDVPALYRGSIVNITPRYGVLVEAQGALIQGVWGSGKEAVGNLRWTERAADAVLDAAGVPDDARNCLLVAGGGVTAGALHRAVEAQASGILMGSLAPELRVLADSLPMPLLVTEGFGKIPMSAPVFELLSALNGQEAALRGAFRARGPNAAKPELFVPLTASRMQESDEADAVEALYVAPGARVRGTAAPYLGRTGTLPDEFILQWMPTEAGTQQPAVMVDWTDGLPERALVPWVNLELIG